MGPCSEEDKGTSFVTGARLKAIGKWKSKEGKSCIEEIYLLNFITNCVTGSYGRLHEIKCPILITNGKDDCMIPTPESFTMWNRLPNAQLILYHNSGDGHAFQHAVEHTKHVEIFLVKGKCSSERTGNYALKPLPLRDFFDECLSDR